MLELIDLRRRFGDVVALDGVSFEVPQGRIVGFVGRNGSGKTTTMRIALGVLEADGGEVRWAGQKVGPVARRRFGYMPEERGLYPKMRVHEQLVYLARLHGTPKDVAGRRANELMQTLEVIGGPKDRIETLSLGNQQRVQLAAALVHDPDLLVLDEPFSGLDPVGVDVLAGVLRDEARQHGAAVVFSSHQLDLVERFCDEVVLIEEGRVVARGTIAQLRAMRSRDLWEVTVLGSRADDWWETVPGVALVEGSDGALTFELSAHADPQRLLDLARAEGDVVRFGPIQPSLAELFREVVQEGAT